MAKKKKVKSVYLLPELIMEILSRLPIKILLRCRCVCKSWLSLISDNNFAASHFQHAATNRLAIINSDDLKSLSIDVDASLHDHSALTLDFLKPKNLEMRGSCRGFVLLQHGYASGKYFYLWNPSTRVNKQIPYYPINDGFSSELLCGFAYDKSNDDYLIVSGFCKFRQNRPVTSSIKLMIFSLRANTWKLIEDAFHLPYQTSDTRLTPVCGLFLNGSIHWILHNYETSKYIIIAFDLKEMTISEIALPDDCIIWDIMYFYDLVEVGGLIGAWTNDWNTVKIWVMQKYGVHSSWTKIIQFSIDPDIHVSLQVVCLTKCGDIVAATHPDDLMKINDKGQLLEPLFSLIPDLVMYKESLFSLPDTGQT